jgi:hypothetical protein
MTNKLRKILPVPVSPIDADESVLPKNMKTLGVHFPNNYLEYGRIYGSGTISVKVYAWEIYSPFRPTYPKFVSRFFKRQDAYRKACETTNVALGLFPERGGLLPFGHRDDVYFCWKTEGDPEAWIVVVLWEYQKGGYEVFEMSFAEFLVNLLTRKIRVAGFKSRWNPKTDITFVPEVYGG